MQRVLSWRHSEVNHNLAGDIILLGLSYSRYSTGFNLGCHTMTGDTVNRALWVDVNVNRTGDARLRFFSSSPGELMGRDVSLIVLQEEAGGSPIFCSARVREI